MLVARSDGSTRRDFNHERFAVYRAAIDQAEQSKFDAIYGHHQIRLANMKTHPDFMRYGHGSRLLRWGIDLAEKDRLAVTVASSPMGKLLYQHMGFTVVEEVRIQLTGETYYVDCQLMVLDRTKTSQDS